MSVIIRERVEPIPDRKWAAREWGVCVRRLSLSSLSAEEQVPLWECYCGCPGVLQFLSRMVTWYSTERCVQTAWLPSQSPSPLSSIREESNCRHSWCMYRKSSEQTVSYRHYHWSCRKKKREYHVYKIQNLEKIWVNRMLLSICFMQLISPVGFFCCCCQKCLEMFEVDFSLSFVMVRKQATLQRGYLRNTTSCKADDHKRTSSHECKNSFVWWRVQCSSSTLTKLFLSYKYNFYLHLKAVQSEQSQIFKTYF